jgi:hypothetical protein
MHERLYENHNEPRLSAPYPRALIGYAILCVIALLWVVLSVLGAVGV